MTMIAICEAYHGYYPSVKLVDFICMNGEVRSTAVATERTCYKISKDLGVDSEDGNY